MSARPRRDGDGSSSQRAQRAQADRAQGADELVQLAAFEVGGELYALDIMRIKEIINPVPITRVPRSPAFLEGVIELRRSILPVMDLRRRFDLPATPATRATKYLITAIDGLGQRWIIGLVVDAVKEVLRIPREEVRAAPSITLGENARYFSGVCRSHDRIVLILDIDQILSSQERITLAGLGDAPAVRSPEPPERKVP